jgi:hypothetical protein
LNQRNNTIYYLILASIAAIITLILAFIYPYSNNNISVSVYDKIVISILFIICCIYGITIAIYPGWFENLIKHKNKNFTNKKSKKTFLKFIGHHPDCEKYKNHTLILKSKTYCAGCFGLIIGSTISILLIIYYTLIELNISKILLLSFLITGIFIIVLAFIEITLSKRNSIIHIISNIFLVLSFLIITISLFEITRSLTNGILAIIFSILWLDTRIHLSNWQHNIICRSCINSCKSY